MWIYQISLHFIFFLLVFLRINTFLKNSPGSTQRRWSSITISCQDLGTKCDSHIVTLWKRKIMIIKEKIFEKWHECKCTIIQNMHGYLREVNKSIAMEGSHHWPYPSPRYPSPEIMCSPCYNILFQVYPLLFNFTFLCYSVLHIF